MNATDAAETACRIALFRSEKLLRVTPLAVLACNRERALYGTACLRELPDVSVKLLQCERSLWEMISIMWEMQDTYDARTRAGEQARKMEFHMLEGSSHFVSAVLVLLMRRWR
jgi:hypothetical protein